ncbi:protein of unknown function [Candidatus Nitrospira inopinata]|uniref:Uncharacterized protein n=1 Tax=Candidatus Nitrospira inopinata TaxID=1715989 RepID=A0A0S4KRY9_9BACT|nr:protein of unknown function [Candidatus Nitrospira inopinata]
MPLPTAFFLLDSPHHPKELDIGTFLVSIVCFLPSFLSSCLDARRASTMVFLALNERGLE